MIYFFALLFGLLQGITELFPISSLGHSIILASFFNKIIPVGSAFTNQSSEAFVVFLVFTHFATSIALFIYFFKDWKKIIIGFFHGLKKPKEFSTNTYSKLSLLLIATTIPAGILGLLFEKKLKLLLSAPLFAGLFLIINAGILYFAEIVKNKKIHAKNTPQHTQKIEYGIHKEAGNNLDENASQINIKQAGYIGIAQALALFPGISRTGVTIAGGLQNGFDHETAARYSFLAATPIIFAAGVLKLPILLKIHDMSVLGPILVGGITAAFASLFAITFLERFFKTKSLKPFALYCLVVGIITIVCFI
jgi:undecaprenyl-diphosphatase